MRDDNTWATCLEIDAVASTLCIIHECICVHDHLRTCIRRIQSIELPLHQASCGKNDCLGCMPCPDLNSLNIVKRFKSLGRFRRARMDQFEGSALACDTKNPILGLPSCLS